MKSSVMITAGVAAMALFALPASAERDERVSIAVDISIYDLASDDGARDAVREIYSAAKEVCDVNRPTVDPRYRIKARQCVDEAMERAVSGEGHNTLASAYARADFQ